MAELYYFNDNGTVYGFTPKFSEVVHDSVTYVPTLIKRSAIKLTDNFAKSPLSFYFSRSHYFAQKVLHTIPERAITAKVTDSISGNIIWTGRVLKAKASLTSIEIICDSIQASNIRAGNRYMVSPQCQHVIYSAACGVNGELYRTNLLDVTITTNSIIDIPTLTAETGYYDNGAISFSGEIRRILKQVGTTLYLASPFTSSGVGVISLWPGCDLTSRNCKAFNNLDNQLAFEFMPDKNPFKSGILV